MLKSSHLNHAIITFAIVMFVLLSAIPGQAQSYTGKVEHLGCDYIQGWAADWYRLDTPISVELYIDGTPIMAIAATGFRQDVAGILGDNGLHGFNIATPLSTRNGQHLISLRFEVSGQDLTGSSQQLTCFGPPPALTADHEVTFTPNQGTPTVVVNHLYRRSDGSRRYDDTNFATIEDMAARQTILMDKSKQTYTIIPWTAPSQGNGVSTPYSAPTTQNLITAGPDPGIAPLALGNIVASCPAPGKGYSVNGTPTPTPTPGSSSGKSTSGGTSTSTSAIQVKIWTCVTMSLPMYVEITDPSSGSTSMEFFNIQTGEPDPQLFSVPEWYAFDSTLTRSTTSAGNCTARHLPTPLILLSNGSQFGQGVMTALTSSPAGCSFVDATTTLGPSIGALALNFKGQGLFHQLFFDTGISPSVVPGADAGIINYTLSDGSHARQLVLLTRF